MTTWSIFTPFEPHFSQSALPSWLAQRRWFQEKSRGIHHIDLVDSAPMHADEQTETILAILGVATNDGSYLIYQLPIQLLNALPTNFPASAIIFSIEINGQSRFIVDALANPTAARSLLHLIRDNGKVRSDGGAFHALSTSAFEGLSSDDLEPVRLSSAEQSHTNLIFGDQLLLKVFRRLPVGHNPDIEITRFLSERTSYRNMPALVGAISYITSDDQGDDNVHSDSAMLQQFIPSLGQGWEWMLMRLSHYYDAIIAHHSHAQSDHISVSALHKHVLDAFQATLQDVDLLALRTAELHRALSSVYDDPNFAPLSFDLDDWRRTTVDILRQSEITRASLRQAPIGSAERIQEAASLLDRLPGWLQNQDRNVDPNRLGTKHRIHGDFHLGQTLRTETDFVFLDFEGEPSKPIEERRRKQSPLRDVAGMLRSFDYAAFAALDAASTRHPDHSESLASHAGIWVSQATTRFCNIYSACDTAPTGFFSPDRHALLSRFLMEKALYELDYELNNRPTWATIPLRGLQTLLGESAIL